MARDKKFPFKPSLSPFTERLAEAMRVKKVSLEEDPQAKMVSAKKRWEELYQDSKHKAAKIEKKKQKLISEKTIKEIEECTFQPHLASKSIDLTRKSDGPTIRKSGIFERNLKWKNDLEESK